MMGPREATMNDSYLHVPIESKTADGVLVNRLGLPASAGGDGEVCEKSREIVAGAQLGADASALNRPSDTSGVRFPRCS